MRYTCRYISPAFSKLVCIKNALGLLIQHLHRENQERNDRWSSEGVSVANFAERHQKPIPAGLPDPFHAVLCSRLDPRHLHLTFLSRRGNLQHRIVSVVNFVESSKYCQFTLLCTFAKSCQYARELHTTLKPNRGCRRIHH